MSNTAPIPKAKILIMFVNMSLDWSITIEGYVPPLLSRSNTIFLGSFILLLSYFSFGEVAAGQIGSFGPSRPFIYMAYHTLIIFTGFELHNYLPRLLSSTKVAFS